MFLLLVYQRSYCLILNHCGLHILLDISWGMLPISATFMPLSTESGPSWTSLLRSMHISSVDEQFYSVLITHNSRRVLKRTFWHIADIPIVVREWSPATASAQPDLTAVPLWVDLQGVSDHQFSHNGLTFFWDTIGRMVKLHPNTEQCVRLDIARLLVVMNLEEPLPASIKVRGSGETISVSYPWLPPRCLDCQKWGHTDKTCSKKKCIKDKEEVAKEKEQLAEGNGTDDLQAGSVVANEVSKCIDIGNPVLEVAHLATVEASA